MTSGQGQGEQHWQLADMRYYADAADAVCVKNIRLCVKFMLEFKCLTRNLKDIRYLIPFGENGLK